MASTEEQVLFEYEDETSYYTWRLARAELEAGRATITLQTIRGRERPFTASISVSAIKRYEMVVKQDISFLGTTWARYSVTGAERYSYSSPLSPSLTTLLPEEPGFRLSS